MSSGHWDADDDTSNYQRLIRILYLLHKFNIKSVVTEVRERHEWFARHPDN